MAPHYRRLPTCADGHRPVSPDSANRRMTELASPTAHRSAAHPQHAPRMPFPRVAAQSAPSRATSLCSSPEATLDRPAPANGQLRLEHCPFQPTVATARHVDQRIALDEGGRFTEDRITARLTEPPSLAPPGSPFLPPRYGADNQCVTGVS